MITPRQIAEQMHREDVIPEEGILLEAVLKVGIFWLIPSWFVRSNDQNVVPVDVGGIEYDFMAYTQPVTQLRDNPMFLHSGWLNSPEDHAENDHTEDWSENRPAESENSLLVEHLDVAPGEEVEQLAILPQIAQV